MTPSTNSTNGAIAVLRTDFDDNPIPGVHHNRHARHPIAPSGYAFRESTTSAFPTA